MDAQLSFTGHNSATRLSPERNGAIRMRLAITAALLAPTMFVIPGEAHAQAMSAEEAATLRAELAALKAKVDTLAARPAPATAEQGRSPKDRRRVGRGKG